MNYNTKQREMILTLLKENIGQGLTARQLIGLMKEKDMKVGTSTLYRRMRSLEEAGQVCSYKVGGERFYEYLECAACREELHLVCEHCQQIIHMNCSAMLAFDRHVLEDHGFVINRPKSVIYGTCRECRKRHA